MTNLLIDIGNSNCKVAFEENGVLGEIFRSSQLDILKFLLSVIEGKELDVIVLSNVREDDKEMERVLSSKCRKLVVLSTDIELPIDIKYSFPPEGLGADRLAGAIAVMMLFPGKDCIKFDFGTALTIDYISKDGVYLGGNISLGMQSRFRALNVFTKRLPLITPDATFEKIGVTTTGAMTAGIVLGLKFEVEGYINEKPDYTAIFTGGDAIYFAEKMKNTIFVIPNLVLMGLVQIAEYYAHKK
jgi:pantothenate kinase, type III